MRVQGGVFLVSVMAGTNWPQFYLPRQCHGILRSASIPTEATQVTLEDIDIVAAIGDSDAAAFAAGSIWFWDYFTEYWGRAYTTGTDQTAITNPTLANLLRVCNPELEGGSKGTDSAIFPSGEGHGLNVAVR